MKIPFFRNPDKDTDIDNLTEQEQAVLKDQPLHYRLNPCDWAAFKNLKKLRLVIYLAELGTSCICCLKTRIWMGLFFGNIIGLFAPSEVSIAIWSFVALLCAIVLAIPTQDKLIGLMAD